MEESLKDSFRELVRKNKFDALFPRLLEHTQKANLNQLHDEISTQESYFRWLSHEGNAGRLDASFILQKHTALSSSLLYLINQLPESIEVGNKDAPTVNLINQSPKIPSNTSQPALSEEIKTSNANSNNGRGEPTTFFTTLRLISGIIILGIVITLMIWRPWTISEDTFYSKAKKTGTIPSLQSYIERFPNGNGKYHMEAKQKLDSLKDMVDNLLSDAELLLKDFKKPEEAKEYLGKVKKLDPDNQQAEDLLKNFK